MRGKLKATEHKNTTLFTKINENVAQISSHKLANTLGGKSALDSIKALDENEINNLNAIIDPVTSSCAHFFKHMDQDSWSSFDCCEGVENKPNIKSYSINNEAQLDIEYQFNYNQFTNYENNHYEGNITQDLHYCRPYSENNDIDFSFAKNLYVQNDDTLNQVQVLEEKAYNDKNIVSNEANKFNESNEANQSKFKVNLPLNKNEQNLVKSKSLGQERRLKSYFYHYRDEFLCEYLQHSGEQHRVAAVLAYGIFRQWMHRRRMSISKNVGVYNNSVETIFYYTAMLLIQTMVFAIRADGRVDKDEHAALVEFCAAVFNQQIKNIRGEIDRMLTIDLDPANLASLVKFPEESLDMYLLSAVMLNGNHILEQSYLETLAACLGIDPSLRTSLDLKAHELCKRKLNSIELNSTYPMHQELEFNQSKKEAQS